MFVDYEKIASPTLGEFATDVLRETRNVIALRITPYASRDWLPAPPWPRGVFIRITPQT